MCVNYTTPQRAEQFDRKRDSFLTSEANQSYLLAPSLRMNGAIGSRPHRCLLGIHKDDLNCTINLACVLQWTMVRTYKFPYVLVALELPLQISLNFNFPPNLFILHGNCIKWMHDRDIGFSVWQIVMSSKTFNFSLSWLFLNLVGHSFIMMGAVAIKVIIKTYIRLYV